MEKIGKINIIKRVILITLCITMILTYIDFSCINVFAANDSYTLSGTTLTIKLNNGTTLTKDWQENSKVADKVSTITKIILKNCNTIGDSAFYGCSSLKEVQLDSSCNLEEIGNNAFKNCSSLISLTDPNSYNSTYGAVHLGYHLKKVGDSAFSGCTSVKRFYVWNDNTVIGSNALRQGGNYVICGFNNSTADTYASSNYCNFVKIYESGLCTQDSGTNKSETVFNKLGRYKLNYTGASNNFHENDSKINSGFSHISNLSAFECDHTSTYLGNSSGATLSLDDGTKIESAWLVYQLNSTNTFSKYPVTLGYKSSKSSSSTKAIDIAYTNIMYSGTQYNYTAYIDITEFIAENRGGYYFCANIPYNNSSSNAADSSASWRIITIESRRDYPLKALSLDMAYVVAQDGSKSKSISLPSGLYTKNGDESNAELFYIVSNSDTFDNGTAYNRVQYFVDKNSADTRMPIETKYNNYVIRSKKVPNRMIMMNRGNTVPSDVAYETNTYYFDYTASDADKDKKTTFKSTSSGGILVVGDDSDIVPINVGYGHSLFGMIITAANKILVINALGVSVDVEGFLFDSTQDTAVIDNENTKITGTTTNETTTPSIGIVDGNYVVYIDEALTANNATATVKNYKMADVSIGGIGVIEEKKEINGVIDNVNHTVTFSGVNLLTKTDYIEYTINCTPNKSGVTYYNNSADFNGFYCNNGNKDAYIQYVDSVKSQGKAKYKLTVKPNGGVYESSSNDTTYVGEVDSTINISNPTRDTYKFLGWTVNGGSLSGTTYKFGTTDGVLTAGWQEPFYINFDANDGTNAPSQTVIYGTGNIPSNIPVRDGYTFLGWGASRNWCTKRIINSGDSGLKSSSDGTNAVETNSSWSRSTYLSNLGIEDRDNINSITVYAQWEKGCRVIYYGNEATSGNTYYQVFNNGDIVTIKDNWFSKVKTDSQGNATREYAFIGWNTKADGSGTWYQPGDAYPSKDNYEFKSLRIYAQWALIYKLTINPNKGKWNGSSQTQTFELKEGDTMEIPAPIRDKYKFMGWKVELNKPTIEIEVEGRTYEFKLLDDNYNNTGKSLYMLNGDIGNRPFTSRVYSYETHDYVDKTIHDFTKDFGTELNSVNSLVTAYKPYDSKEDVYAFILSKEDEEKYESKISGYEHWVREEAKTEPITELREKPDTPSKPDVPTYEKIEQHCGKCGSTNVSLQIGYNNYIRYRCSECSGLSYTYIIQDTKDLVCAQDNNNLTAVDGDSGVYKCENEHYHIIYSCPSCNSPNTKVEFLPASSSSRNTTIKLSCYDCGDIYNITSSSETKISDGDVVTCAYCNKSDKLELQFSNSGSSFGNSGLYPRYICKYYHGNSYDPHDTGYAYTYIARNANRCASCNGILKLVNNYYQCNNCNYRYTLYKCHNCKSSNTSIINLDNSSFTVSCDDCDKAYKIAQASETVCASCGKGSVVYICNIGGEELQEGYCYEHGSSAHKECNSCHMDNPSTTTKNVITETEVEPLKYAYCSHCYHTEFQCTECNKTWYGSKYTECPQCKSIDNTYCTNCGVKSNYDIHTREQKYSALYCDKCESTEHITSYSNCSSCNNYSSHSSGNANLVVVTPSNNAKYVYTYYYTENDYSTSYKNEIKETTKTTSHYIRPVILLDTDTSCLTSLTEDAIFTMGDCDVKLTAQWAIAHNLHVDPNKGVWNGKSEISDIVLARGETKIIKAPERKGYTFTEWSKTIGKNTYEDEMEIDTYKFSLLDKNYNSTGNALYVMKSPLGLYKYFIDNNGESINTVTRDLGTRLKELSKDRDIMSKTLEHGERVYSFILNENEANKYKGIFNLKDSWIRKGTTSEPIVSAFGELPEYTALTPHCGKCESANVYIESGYAVCDDCNERTSIIKDTGRTINVDSAEHLICSDCGYGLDKIADKETYKCSNNHYSIILSCPDCNSHNTRIIDNSFDSLKIGCYDCGHENEISTTKQTEQYYVCNSCLSKIDNVEYRCSSCGQYTLTDLNDNGKFTCSNCKKETSSSGRRCPTCHSSNISKQTRYTYTCDSCDGKSIEYRCSRCGEYVITDDTYNGKIYCPHCSQSVSYINRRCANTDCHSSSIYQQTYYKYTTQVERLKMAYYECNDCHDTGDRLNLYCNSCNYYFSRDTLNNGINCNYCGSSDTEVKACYECGKYNDDVNVTLKNTDIILHDANMFAYCNKCYSTQFKCKLCGDTWDGTHNSSCPNHSIISSSYCVNCGEESCGSIELIHKNCSALYCKECDSTNITELDNKNYVCSNCKRSNLIVLTPSNNERQVAYFVNNDNVIKTSSVMSKHSVIPVIVVSTDYGQFKLVNRDEKIYEFTMGNVDSTLTANWTPNNYTLTLDPNGGVLSGVSEYTLTFDSTDNNNISGSTVTRVAYDFDGWYTEKQGGVKVYDVNGACTNDGTYWKDGKCAYDGDYTLYAHWTPITYYVRLYKNQPPLASSKVVKASSDNTWTNNNTYYEKQFIYDETIVPSLDFYSLTGWHVDSNNWYKQGNDGAGFGGTVAAGSKNITTVKNDVVSLYPNWKKNKYTIKYDGNNTTYNIYGDKCSTTYTGTTDQTNCEYDTEVIIANNGFSKVGYKFKHWNTESDNSGTVYKEGQKVRNLTAENNGSITLYAIWEPIVYNIEFNGNDNFNADTVGISYKQQMRFDKSATLLPNKFTRQNNYNWNGTQIDRGYTFLGWVKAEGNDDTTRKANANKNYKATYIDKQSVINLSSVDNSTVYLYAMWEKKDITLTFNLNGGKYVKSGDPIVLKGTIWNMQKTYPFKIDGTEQTEGLPNYSVQNGKIDAFGISDNDGFNNKYAKSVNGVAYRFLGWSRNPSATVPDSDLHVLLDTKPATFTITDNTTLYAVWEPVLQSRITLNRSLGNLDFVNSGTSYSVINDTGSITAQKTDAELAVIIRPGEQGQYEIFNTIANTDVTVVFDSSVNKMYDEPGTWTDSLNPSTSEDLVKTPPQSNGLNRHITGDTSCLLRKFYMPQYIGTSQSHPGVKADNYSITFTMKSNSWFYATKGKEEKIIVKAKVYVQNEVGKEVISILDELRTRLKIRIKDK